MAPIQVRAAGPPVPCMAPRCSPLPPPGPWSWGGKMVGGGGQ